MPVTPSKSVLVIDDSRVARMLIHRIILDIHPDWVILEAACGQEGLELARSKVPDYITMDFNMPDMNGVEAAEQILLSTPKAVIVLFTANVQAKTQSKTDNLGIGFVSKPVTNDAVLQALAFFASKS